MKNKPFLSRPWSLAYIGTVVLAQGYWVLESYANFAYFNNINERLFPITRPFEAVFRYVGPSTTASTALLMSQRQRSMADIHHHKFGVEYQVPLRLQDP